MRCRSAISMGWYPEVRTKQEDTRGLHTRCSLNTVPAHNEHIGKGLSQFDYQRWHWFDGDRRLYETDRTDEHAWEIM